MLATGFSSRYFESCALSYICYRYGVGSDYYIVIIEINIISVNLNRY